MNIHNSFEKELLDDCIFALPCAGGSSVEFWSWRNRFSSNKLSFLDYAGHLYGKNELLDKSIEDIADNIVKNILCFTQAESNLYLFGHSMGGLIAYEVAESLLLNHNILVKGLILSSCFAPSEKLSNINFQNLENTNRYHSRFEDSIKLLKVLELKKHLENVMHHDFRLILKYLRGWQDENITKLPIPITCIYGKQDPLVNKLNVADWSKFSQNTVKFFELEGGHFYFDDNPDSANKMFEIINDCIL